MRFTTVGGSTYEMAYIDGGGVLVRRLEGVKPGTPRTGGDGMWKGALAVYPEIPIVGLPMLIHWKMNEDGTMNCTQTSKVARVGV